MTQEPKNPIGDIETRLFINNEFVPAKSGRDFPVINPANGEVVTQVHEASEEDVNDAVNSAEAAFPAWSSLAGFERAKYLYRLADLYEQHVSNLAKLEAISMGRPVSTYRKSFLVAAARSKSILHHSRI